MNNPADFVYESVLSGYTLACTSVHMINSSAVGNKLHDPQNIHG